MAHEESFTAARMTPRSVSRPALPEAALVGSLFLIAAFAWAITVRVMGGMDAGPGTDPGAIGFFLTAWVAMMAAMMLPSTYPMVLMHARLTAARRERGVGPPPAAGAIFVAGYLAAWLAVGLLAWGVVEIGRSLSPQALSWDRAGPYVAGGVIAAAAVYQLTPLKDACLRRCRNPFLFLIGSWRDGRRGQALMGLEHGAWCAGCCWALMATLFALGFMSLLWMAFVAALVAVEKLLPCRRAASLGAAAVLLVLGVAIAVAPSDVPGLTLPDAEQSASAGPAMDGMEMR